MSEETPAVREEFEALKIGLRLGHARIAPRRAGLLLAAGDASGRPSSRAAGSRGPSDQPLAQW